MWSEEGEEVIVNSLTESCVSVNIEAMTSERTDLARRAAWHAALADPVRLRIVDLLALGDRSPGELRDALSVPSNLLAHHLGVLETEGIVSRRRSEGDRRRSYVHLRPKALAAAAPGPAPRARRLLFVCTGNSARSPLAAAFWTTVSPIPAVSAGTRPADRTSANAIAVAERHGLDLTDHIPRRMEELRAEGDVVVTLCDRAHEDLGGSVLHWSIPNPRLRGTPDAYEAAFEDIAGRVQVLALRLTAA